MRKLNKTKNIKIDASNFYDYWCQLTERYPNEIALHDDYINATYTYKEAFNSVKKFASGLKTLGLKKADHIAMFSENSAHWMIADQAILISGMVNAVRGAHTPIQELSYIIKHSDSVALIVENIELARKLNNEIKNTDIKLIIHLSNETVSENEFKIPIYSFKEILTLGEKEKFEPSQVNKEDLATLIYTSGTTSQPKGVMLTQYNILSQVKNAHSIINATSGRALCILPIWHAYERTVEYYLLSQGATLYYTNILNFKKDLTKYKPHYLASVPRIWESIYEGVQHKLHQMPQSKQTIIKGAIQKSIRYKNAKRLLNNQNLNHFYPNAMQKTMAVLEIVTNYPVHLIASKTIHKKIKNAIGEQFRFGISGGGGLAQHLGEFFDAVDIQVMNGYGLTESSPVISVKNLSNNVLGSIGQPVDETQIKVCSQKTFKKLPKGKKGILFVKGPQVMKGYYKNPEATKEVIDPQGWLNTGDLVKLAPDGSIIITGRAKDIIVLSNGENIEPQAIEEACLQSPMIKQIVLTGQDKSSLGALVVPDYEYISKNIQDSSQVQTIIKKEVQQLTQARKNYSNFERVSNVRLLNEEFSLDNGLMTQTMKIKRNKVFQKYSNIIEDMFS